MSKYESDDFGDAGQIIKEVTVDGSPKKVTYRSWMRLRRDSIAVLPWNALRTVFVAGVHFDGVKGVVLPT